jgi:feruloyl esterase
MHQGFRSVAVVLVVAGATSTAHSQAFADLKSALVDYSRSDITARKPCADMNAYKAKDLVEIRAEEIAALSNTPKYCRVSGVIAPEVAFEVSLPEKWNGRFYMIGNGGHAGESLADAGRTSQRDAALRIGFAFAQTNTGHYSSKEPGGTFVLSNPQKAIDYAYRAVHVTAATAKDIAGSFYAQKVQYSYWNSCSNGGRQGLLEAQRYPEDFDGVIANAPWLDQTGFALGAMWNQRALGNATPLTAEKLTTLGQAVMARCDAIDGLKDGVIGDPRKCDFDARQDVSACAAGTDLPTCLTSAQADAVMSIYRGPHSNGKSLFPGFMPGSEAVVTGNNGTNSAWLGMIVPAQPNAKPAVFNLAEGTMRYLVPKSPLPDYDTSTFDFTRDLHLLDAWAKVANATSPNLDRFRMSGGKLLMTYGWSDQILQPLMGVQYYEKLQARYGKSTGEFARLFMVPGMTHCSGGNGTDTFDSVTAIVNWVEKGRAPHSLAASRVVGGKTVRTRPVCAYPLVARYRGMGSTDDAASFSCTAP